MQAQDLYGLAADAILVVHAAFVAFVVVGLAAIILGAFRDWVWIRNPWFRAAHLLAIGIVVLQAWLGRLCPLTTWEMALRERAGGDVYDVSFVAYWLRAVIFYEAPAYVFTIVYTVFAALVVAAYVWVRPRSFVEDNTHAG